MLSNASRLFWLRRYWPTMMMVFVILLVGFDIYDRHHGFGYDPARAWDDSKPLEEVYKHTFENETVVLDNKHLVGPNKFDNVTIIYNGLGPFAVDDPTWVLHDGKMTSRIGSGNKIVTQTIELAMGVARASGCPVAWLNVGPQQMEGVRSK